MTRSFQGWRSDSLHETFCTLAAFGGAMRIFGVDLPPYIVQTDSGLYTG